MTDGRASRRCEERKFKRLFVRYGRQAADHRAVALQISTRGLFLSTNEHVFAKGCAILIEIVGPGTTWIVTGIVRHAFKVHPNMARYTRPGMGVELTDAPEPCRAFLASL